MGKKLQFTELDQYLFGQGSNYDIYWKLGAHPDTQKRKNGVYFAVWAPNAQAVSVIGEFNEWDTEKNPMKKVGPIGVYETFVPGAKIGQLYKFYITGAHGEELYKADPYANAAEMRPGTASRITDITNYKWKDDTWMKNRENFDPDTSAMSIYEVHPGSWMKHPQTAEDEDGFYSYRELAPKLAQYVKKMGYTHVELMGIAEHPFDGSWGYQVTGYYAPTSRYGTPQDFKYLVDYLHRQKIGIILDWVPAHFPKDAHGLVNFDGTAVYEHADPRQGEHPDWGTKIYNYGRPEVKNFLIANALYWVEECHVDGLRVDAVASMLYLDYGKKDGEWIANKYGGNKNLEAIEFFKHLNTVVLGRNHGTVMIAEESTAWPMVTGKAEDDGLGFSLKWNMGWMNDTLDYFRTAPEYRSRDYHKLTFSMMYYYNDVFLLPLSHDEVVHGKATIAQKMHGEYEEKFPQARAFYMYMYAHPGKKLNFMGNEIGQLREWDEKREQDWDILKYPIHDAFHHFMQKLNHLYMTTPALSAKDYENAGFHWLDCHQEERCIYAFERTDGKERIAAVFNFSDEDQEGYELPITDAKELEVILASDDVTFGGSKKYTKKKVKVTDGKAVLDLSAYSAVYYSIAV